LTDNSAAYNKKLEVHNAAARARAYRKCGVFEGKQYLIYDWYKDPIDGTLLACISARKDDVAACEVFLNGYVPMVAVPDPPTWSLMEAVTGPGRVSDFMRYVVLDREESV
jgi:hypothetical protein